MDDLISRLEALQALENEKPTPFVNEDRSIDPFGAGRQKQWYRDCIAVLHLPSAQRWIPCSERLPEEADGTVLVCMPNESPYNGREPFINAKHNQRVETATYSQYSDTWYFAMGAVSETRPVAWMPLPEPYKGEEE